MTRKFTMSESMEPTSVLWEEPRWSDPHGWEARIPPVIREHWDKLPREAKWVAWCTADLAYNTGADSEESMTSVHCPQCQHVFKLQWDDDYTAHGNVPPNLVISACESGGIYGVSVRCPKCRHEERIDR